MIVGIDLGTTNSAIGVWRDGAAVLIPNSLVGLGDVQFKARVAATLAGAMAVMFSVGLAEDLQLPAPFLQLGGLMLLAVGLMSLGMAFYNQVKQRR